MKSEGGIALKDAKVIQERSLLDMWMRGAKRSSNLLSPGAIWEFVPPTFPCLTQTGVSPGTKCRKRPVVKSWGGGRASSYRADSGATLARHVDEEGRELKLPPLAKCHLGLCTSNLHQSDSDKGESRYKLWKRPL